MKLGLCLGASMLRGVAAGTSIEWNFTGDPALFQDTGGTTPALNGDQIGLVDLAGYPLTQSVALDRPIRKTSNSSATFTSSDALVYEDASVNTLMYNHAITTTVVPASIAADMVFFGAGPTVGNGFIYYILRADGRFRVTCRDTLNITVQDKIYTVTTAPAVGVPYKVAFSHVGTTFKLWINDILEITDATVDLSAQDTVYTGLAMGNWYRGGAIGTAGMNGDIVELGIASV